MRYYIKVRTPDDPKGWTAKAEGEVGTPYSYISGDVAVELSWNPPKFNIEPSFIQFNPVPKPSSTKKVRGKKTIDPVSSDE
jgi:hypothetical protein